MAKFKVGDYITPSNSLRDINVYEVLALDGTVRLISKAGHILEEVGDVIHRDIRERLYILSSITPNPNLITVSSTNYKDDVNLTQEDKKIIKEYLYENS